MDRFSTSVRTRDTKRNKRKRDRLKKCEEYEEAEEDGVKLQGWNLEIVSFMKLIFSIRSQNILSRSNKKQDSLDKLRDLISNQVQDSRV